MKLAYEYYEVNKQNKNYLNSAFYLSTHDSSYNVNTKIYRNCNAS